MERGIKRALQDFEAVLRDLLDAEEDAVAMQGSKGDSLEDEHVERALEEVEVSSHAGALS